MLEAHIPADKLQDVKRILYGYNMGAPVQELQLPEEALQDAKKFNFEIKGFVMRAQKEQNRPPRIVRIGLVQNQIVKPTTDPVMDQVRCCDASSTDGCAVPGYPRPHGATHRSCWQSWNQRAVPARGLEYEHRTSTTDFESEAMPFAFCTREKYPWVEFAMDAETGPATKFCQRVMNSRQVRC